MTNMIALLSTLDRVAILHEFQQDVLLQSYLHRNFEEQ